MTRPHPIECSWQRPSGLAGYRTYDRREEVSVLFMYLRGHRALVGRDEPLIFPLFVTPPPHHNGINQAVKYLLHYFTGHGRTSPVLSSVVQSLLGHKYTVVGRDVSSVAHRLLELSVPRIRVTIGFVQTKEGRESVAHVTQRLCRRCRVETSPRTANCSRERGERVDL